MLDTWSELRTNVLVCMIFLHLWSEDVNYRPFHWYINKLYFLNFLVCDQVFMEGDKTSDMSFAQVCSLVHTMNNEPLFCSVELTYLQQRDIRIQHIQIKIWRRPPQSIHVENSGTPIVYFSFAAYMVTAIGELPEKLPWMIQVWELHKPIFISTSHAKPNKAYRNHLHMCVGFTIAGSHPIHAHPFLWRYTFVLKMKREHGHPVHKSNTSGCVPQKEVRNVSQKLKGLLMRWD